MQLLSQTDTHTSYFLSVTVAAGTPAAQKEPLELWTSHKYDVGQIKNCELVVMPKSDYRPCQPQYPLKPEAIAGIIPVFESLLKTGVIVPCPNSPVRTPLFPEKKIREAGQPTE